MSDRAPASFTLYYTSGKEKALAELFNNWGFDIEGRAVTENGIVDGVTLGVDEISVGILSELGGVLESLGVAYRGSQDAKYEYDGSVRYFIPGLGSEDFEGNNNGEMVVFGRDVTKIANKLTALYADGETCVDSGEVAKIVAEFSELCGNRYVDAFNALGG